MVVVTVRAHLGAACPHFHPRSPSRALVAARRPAPGSTSACRPRSRRRSGGARAAARRRRGRRAASSRSGCRRRSRSRRRTRAACAPRRSASSSAARRRCRRSPSPAGSPSGGRTRRRRSAATMPGWRGAVERLAEQADELVVVGEADRGASSGARSRRDARVLRVRVEREHVHHRPVRPDARYAAPRSSMKRVGECVCREADGLSLPRAESEPPITLTSGEAAFSAS